MTRNFPSVLYFHLEQIQEKGQICVNWSLRSSWTTFNVEISVCHSEYMQSRIGRHKTRVLLSEQNFPGVSELGWNTFLFSFPVCGIVTRKFSLVTSDNCGIYLSLSLSLERHLVFICVTLGGQGPQCVPHWTTLG